MRSATLKRPVTMGQTLAVLAVFALACISPALAQDVIGAKPVSDAAIAVFKVIAVAAICFGFFRMMSGRHTIEGLVTVAVGALGVAKTDAVVSLFGL